jgi:hypothetical protein
MKMTMHVTRVLCILLIPAAMAVFATAAFGADKPEGSWADVQKIEFGTAMEVVQSGSIRLRGKLVSVTEDAVILRIGAADRSFERATLRSVAVRHSLTKKGALIGLLVGLAFAYPNAKLTGPGAAVGGIVSDTAIGAAIGALTKGYRIVYRAAPAGLPPI